MSLLRDEVKFTGRERYSRSIQSEVGSCCQRGTHVCGSGRFLRTRKRLRPSSAKTLLYEANVHGPLVITPHLLKEHLGGKSIRRKLSPKGGEPQQMYGGESTTESRYIARSVCGVPWSPTCETVKERRSS